MINKEKLIEWCWDNLEFYNCPESWEDTYIVDILNGYNGDARMKNGTLLRYYQIRDMFREDD
mgnify:CR=1 FL=1